MNDMHQVNVEAIQDFFAFRISPYGRSVWGGQLAPFKEFGDYDQVRRALTQREDLHIRDFGTMVSNRLLTGLDKDRPVFIALSGGIDSCLLAMILTRLDFDVTAVTVEVENEKGRSYSEARDAYDIAMALNMEIQPYTFTSEEGTRIMPKAIKVLGEPIDRGSGSAAYFLYEQMKGQQVVVGQFADSVFQPVPFKAKLGPADMKRLFKKPYEGQFDLPKYSDDPIKQIYAFEFFNCVPHEAETLEHFALSKHFGVDLLMPYADAPILAKALRQCPYSEQKLYARVLAADMAPHGFPLELLCKPKKALNFQPEEVGQITGKFFDEDWLNQLGIFNDNIAWEKETDWTRYSAALLCIWLEQAGGFR